jgi:hypothetical protein
MAEVVGAEAASFFIRINPLRSRCRTRRSAVIRAIMRSASRTTLALIDQGEGQHLSDLVGDGLAHAETLGKRENKSRIVGRFPLSGRRERAGLDLIGLPLQAFSASSNALSVS